MKSDVGTPSASNRGWLAWLGGGGVMAGGWFRLGVVVFVVAILGYLTGLTGEIFFDNEPVILLDQRIQSSEGLGEILTTQYWAGTVKSTLFRPLTTTSYLLNYTWLGGGPSPLGYHILNTLLHAVTAALLFVLVRRLGGTPLLALGAGLLFAAHPVATEAVTNIVGRADVLAALFVIAASVAFISMRQKDRPGLGRLWPALFFFLGMASKESGIVFLAIAIALEVLFGRTLSFRRDRKRLALDYGGLVISLIVMHAWRLWVIKDIPPREFFYVDNPLVLGSLLEREATVLDVLGRYAYRLVFPLTLSGDYSYRQIEPVTDLARPFFWIGVVVFGSCLFFMVAMGRKKPMISLALAIMTIALAPVSNALILIGTIMAERLLYLPLAGFAILAAIGVVRVARALSGRDASKHVRLALSVFAVLTLLLSVRTAWRNLDWRTELDFWSATHQTSPKSVRAINGHAKAHHKRYPGRPEEAAAIQRSILEVDPKSPRGLARLAEYQALSAQNKIGGGDLGGAEALLKEAQGHLDVARESDDREAASWMERNEWYAGLHLAAPLREGLVYQSQSLVHQAGLRLAKAKGVTPDSSLLDAMDANLRRRLMLQPSDGAAALEWTSLLLSREQPTRAVTSILLLLGGQRLPGVNPRHLIGQTLRQFGLSPERYQKKGRQVGFLWPSGDSAEVREYRNALAGGWRTVVRLYRASGNDDVARNLQKIAVGRGIPAEVLQAAFGPLPSPDDPSFWQ